MIHIEKKGEKGPYPYQNYQQSRQKLGKCLENKALLSTKNYAKKIKMYFRLDCQPEIQILN